MPKSRSQKEQDLQTLIEELGRIAAAVTADYHGLSVRELEELRSSLREQNVRFRVVKNTLLQRATEAAGLPVQDFAGPVGLALGFGDAVQTVKAMAKFAKEHPALELTGGMVDGQHVDVVVIKQLAALPSREELLGRLVGSLSAPARNLAGVLSAAPRNLVYALKAVEQQKA